MTTGLYWVSSAFNVDSAAWGPLWGVPATIALAMVLALFFGAGCALAMTAVDARRAPHPLVRRRACSCRNGCAAICCSAAFRGCCPATSGRRASRSRSSLRSIGIYGLSLLTLLVAAAPAAIADGGRAGRRFAPTLVAALARRPDLGLGRAASRARADRSARRAARRARRRFRLEPGREMGRASRSGMARARALSRRQRPARRAAPPSWCGPRAPFRSSTSSMLENPAFLDALGRGLGDRVLIVGPLRAASCSAEGIAYLQLCRNHRRRQRRTARQRANLRQASPRARAANTSRSGR